VTLSSKLIPSSGCLLGAWVSNSCTAGSGFDGRFRTFEGEIGRTASTNGLLNIFHQFSWFPDYATAFPSAAEQSLLDEGRLMLLNWTPKSSTGAPLLWADVAAGNYDAAYVDPTAAHIRDYGKTLFIAIHTEPDGDMSENGGAFGSAADYVAMHKHIRARFDLAGASNLVWVWNTAAYFATMGLQSGTAFNRLYPGDSQIDLLAFDPYSNGETFAQVFGTKHPFVQWSRGTNGGGINKCPALVTPTGLTVVPQGTTGATTRSYRVSAVNQQGETLACAAVQITNSNATLSSTNFNRITWTGQNATYYKVYGRTAGSELLLATVQAPTTTYDDKGTATPSGALPASNTATSDLAKMIMIPEWGVSNWSGRPQYFADFQSALKSPPYDAIKAALYWNSVFSYSVCLETQPAAVTAFGTLAADPFFTPDMSPTPPPSALIAFRGASSVAMNSETLKTVTVPATAQAGDGVLIWFTCNKATVAPVVITAPSGLPLVATQDNVPGGSTEMRSRFYKAVVGTTIVAGQPLAAGQVLTFTTDVVVRAGIELSVWSGTDPTDPVDQWNASNRTTAATTVTTPNVTTLVVGDWIVSAYFDRAQVGASNTAWTPPQGPPVDTLRTSSYGSGTDGRVSGGVSDDATAHPIGTYGGRVATANATSAIGIGWTVALKPAGAAAGTDHIGALHQA
jgi:hypothetical protein